MRNISIQWSKLLLVSILQLFGFIAIFILAFFVSVSFRNYGWEYVIYDKRMPIGDEAIRVGLMWVVALSTFLTGYTLYLSIKLFSFNKFLIYHFGFLSWVLIPYYVFQSVKESYWSDFSKYLLSNRNEGLQISHLYFWQVITRKKRVNKLFWNTLLGYLTFIASIIGVISIFITFSNDSSNSRASNVMFHFLVWFTSFSNETLFLFMLAFIFLHKKYFFRENTVLTYIAGYMFVVFLVFWTYLFPQEESLGSPMNAFKSIWLHAINPLLIVIFCINSYFQNCNAPKKSWWKFCLIGSVFPLTYALFAYLLPFVVHFSIYGSLTNLNPDMITSAGDHMGSPIWIIGFFVLVLIFNLIYLILRYINLIVYKKTIQSSRSESNLIN